MENGVSLASEPEKAGSSEVKSKSLRNDTGKINAIPV